MGIKKVTLSSHATAISMPLYERKELQMNLGGGDTQAIMTFNPGSQQNKNMYKITIIQGYYIQDNSTKRIVVHGNLSPIYIKADPLSPFAMTNPFTSHNDVLVSPCSKARLPGYAHNDPSLRQSL